MFFFLKSSEESSGKIFFVGCLGQEYSVETVEFIKTGWDVTIDSHLVEYVCRQDLDTAAPFHNHYSADSKWCHQHMLAAPVSKTLWLYFCTTWGRRDPSSIFIYSPRAKFPPHQHVHGAHNVPQSIWIERPCISVLHQWIGTQRWTKQPRIFSHSTASSWDALFLPLTLYPSNLSLSVCLFHASGFGSPLL